MKFLNLFRKKIKRERRHYFDIDALNELASIWKGWKQKPVYEIGGLIFGRVDYDLFIDSITSVKNKYVHFGHSNYDPDTEQMKAQITESLLSGAVPTGEWHTHPSGRITPSADDISIMKEKAIVMDRYILIILTERNIGIYLFEKGILDYRKIV